jgi:hypothetical protein
MGDESLVFTMKSAYDENKQTIKRMISSMKNNRN